jgi:hypothetical protein
MFAVRVFMHHWSHATPVTPFSMSDIAFKKREGREADAKKEEEKKQEEEEKKREEEKREAQKQLMRYRLDELIKSSISMGPYMNLLS